MYTTYSQASIVKVVYKKIGIDNHYVTVRQSVAPPQPQLSASFHSSYMYYFNIILVLIRIENAAGYRTMNLITI